MPDFLGDVLSGVATAPSSTRTNAVVMTCDRGYFAPALFVAHQLKRLADRSYDVFIFHIGRAVPHQQPDGVTVVEMRPEEVSNSGARNGASPAVFARLHVDRWLPARYRTLLYLDCDLWIEGPSLDPLFSVDFAGYPVAAVRDNAEVFARDKGAFFDYRRRIGMDDRAHYFNSGVMVIDRERWVAERLAERTLRYIAEADNLQHNDQTALNAVINGHWRELSPRWNWTYATRARLTALVKPHIVHFIGSSKPWDDRRGRFPVRYSDGMRPFYHEAGFAYCFRPTPLPLRWRRSISNRFQSIRAAVYDRREAVVRAHLSGTDFCALSDPTEETSSAL